jgi:muramidase (phage lysozyme)
MRQGGGARAPFEIAGSTARGAPTELSEAQRNIAAPGSQRRQLMDLIGRSEGTDRARGYNETLGYGRYTGGNVDLTSMTLAEVSALQRRMLAHPENRQNSSAVGRYQIVGTTMRGLIQEMGLNPNETRFTPEIQDAMAARLLERRGMSRVERGQMTPEQFQNGLAREWASLPTTEGAGAYAGQRAHVSGADVQAALRPGEGMAGPVPSRIAGMGATPTPLAPQPENPIVMPPPAPPAGREAQTSAQAGAPAEQRFSAVAGGGPRDTSLAMQSPPLEAAPGIGGLTASDSTPAPSPFQPPPRMETSPTSTQTGLGTPLPHDERQRGLDVPGSSSQQVQVASQLQVAPLRVEHISGATGEAIGTEYLPITQVDPARGLQTRGSGRVM